MSSENENSHNVVVEAVVALIYAVLLVACTIILQGAVKGYLDQFSVYVGGTIVAVFSFIFAMILTGIGKAVIKLLMGDHFLVKSFVILSCVFLVVACAVSSQWLMVWWLTAFFSVIGTILAFFKKLFRRKVKNRVREVRELERDLRHQSISDMKEIRDRLRGKR
ncbi:MAG: hypothetical protein MJZ38_06080 [archaeon]|nr:hypothetical protein [archaeon]